ncbi:MAG TPA: aldehyde dehydrogenase family protein [Dermatophilaceae bacterium]|nr:aldehyde dehydrogenase family protein [Dermatophilaceae bacterium]
MTEIDADLRSVQEARDLAVTCRAAQREFATASQEQVDRACAAMAEAVHRDAARLGRMACEETGYGVPAHKQVKVEFASRAVWESIRDIPTVGVLRRDPERRTVEIGWPVGVVVALTPSTNPSSTAVFKVLVSVKARNGIVVAPHPAAAECTYEAVRLMAEAGERAGMPAGLVACLRRVTLPGTQELMRHHATSLILATGGTPMVRAAHSTGKPAIGVGPGNVPVYVDRSADVAAAASAIVNSKAFDSSVICATEQSVVADRPVAETLRAEMRRQGAHWVSAAEKRALERVLFTPGGGMDPVAVGRTPQQLATLAGFAVPASARILVADLEAVGRVEPLSGEKLTTVLGFYVEDGWRAGCERCVELLHFGGDGHSLVIHATDEDVVLAFGIEKPAFRILVNTWGTLGAIGATTGVMPSMTLAPGGIGGSVVSDNITVHHLLNVKRVAYPLREPPAAARALAPGVVAGPVAFGGPSATESRSADPEVDRIVRRVLRELGGAP